MSNPATVESTSLYMVKNPTSAPRVIYSGLKGGLPIRIEAGTSLPNPIELTDKIAQELIDRTTNRPGSDLELKKISKPQAPAPQKSTAAPVPQKPTAAPQRPIPQKPAPQARAPQQQQPAEQTIEEPVEEYVEEQIEEQVEQPRVAPRRPQRPPGSV